MKKFLMLVKISSMAISLSACNSFPEFPEWNPSSVVQSQNKAFKCRLVNKESFIFECEKESIPFTSLADGQFCTSPEETKNLINWAKEVKALSEKESQTNGF